MNRNKGKKLQKPNDELIKKLRKELRETIFYLGPQPSGSSEAFERMVTVLQVDPVSFHQRWIQPLLEAGATIDIAVACIAQSYLQPN
jgi:hypothetical protein